MSNTTTVISTSFTQDNSLDNLSNSKTFQDECKYLLDVFKCKGLRRYNNSFKSKFGPQWKRECTLSEFVWNYCKTPKRAAALMDYINENVIDDKETKQWLCSSNLNIDPDITFIELEDCLLYLVENPKVQHVHVLSDKLDAVAALVDFSTQTRIPQIDPDSCVFEINDTRGDLLHGLIIGEDDVDKIQYVSIKFDMNDNTSTKYIVQRAEFENNLYVIKESSEKESTIYYLPFFKHPIPLMHLINSETKIEVQVSFYSDVSLDHVNQSDVYCLFTVLNDRLRKWLESRSLVLTLKDDDMLRIGPNVMRIISDYE